MNTRQVVSGLVAFVTLAIAFVVGRQSRTGCPQNTKCITISKVTPPPTTGATCQVDSPIMNMKYSHHVKWFSTDDEYRVFFLKITPPPGYPPLPTGHPPANPLVPYQEPVIIPAGGHSRDFTVKQVDDYYLYAIFDLTVDPTLSNPCKASTDDKDTRLNVKP